MSTARIPPRSWCSIQSRSRSRSAFPSAWRKTPTGLAYDAKTNRLFIGTRNEPKMVVMDAVTGKVISSFPIGAGVDFAGFDPDARLIFFSCNDGTLNIYHEKIFLPAAEYLDAVQGQKGCPIKPGSFVVLVVGKSWKRDQIDFGGARRKSSRSQFFD